MLACFLGELGCSEHSLDSELARQIRRKSAGYTAIGEGFDDQKNIRRSAPAQAGNGVEEFFLDVGNNSHTRKNRLGAVLVGLCGVGAARECRRGPADEGGRVGDSEGS